MYVIRKNKIKLLFSFMVCFAILFSNVSFSQDTEKKNILIFKVKCDGCIKPQELMSIRDTLGNITNYNIDIEMMDCIWNNNKINYEMVYDIYRHKFKDRKFDIVVTCDDTSLEFVRRYHNELFNKVPVVFCGVSETKDILKLNPDFFTGIVHKIDIKSTVDIALKIHPDKKIIIVAADETIRTNYNEAFQQLKVDNTDVEFIFVEEMKLKELQEKMHIFSEKAICLYSGSLEDDNENIIPMFNIGDFSSKYKIPVYSPFEFLLDKGIVGGMMSRGYSRGIIASEMTQRILDGEKVTKIPIVLDSFNQYMFDFKEMKKHGIKLSDIPEDSIVINEHLNGFYISKEQFYHVILPYFIIFLLGVIISQYIAIYKLKKVRQALRESEERLRTIINATPDIILIRDEEGRLLDCNKSFLDTFNLNDKQYIGKTYAELSEINELCKGAHLTCEITDRKAWEKGGIIQIEETVKLTDGSTKIYDMIKVPLFNDDGTRKGIVVLGRDITVRKQVEEKLHSSEQRYRCLVELLPDGVFIHDGDRIEFVNVSGMKILGAKKLDQVIGKQIIDFVHSDSIEDVKERCIQVQKRKTTLPLDEQKLIRCDGKLINIETNGGLINIDDETKQITVIRDITERKRAKDLQKRIEETIQYNKLKTEFFANISHELRTPLNVILGATQMFKFVLNDMSLDNNLDKIETYLNMIQQNSFRLIRLVNNLIDITKMDTGFFEIHLQNCNIISIVEDITLSVGDYIEYQNVELVFDTDVEEKIMACDPDKIERIMLNLLSNAVKFTEPGGNVKVNIQDRADSITIAVKDTGVGVPQDKLEEIFEMFKQVDKSFKRRHEGSGIGLSLVKSLVKMHKGTIYAESEYGKGSKFVIELPVQIIEDGDVKTISDDMQQNHVERINIEFSDIYI